VADAVFQSLWPVNAGENTTLTNRN
jgi:hypothetical protein